MSWLLAASVPGFLMLSTVGLQRLESVLHNDEPSAAQRVTRLEKAARTAREEAATRILDEFPGGGPRRAPVLGLLADEPGLPTRPNPLFRPSELANPV